MVQPTIPKCPRCGAPLPRVGAGWATRCGFCNADVTLGMPATRMPERPFHAPPAPPRSGSPAVILGAVLGVTVLSGAIAVLGVKSRSVRSNDPGNPFGGTDPFQWDPRARVVVVSLPGHAREAFVGRVRPIVDSDRSRPMHVHVALFSGETFATIWQSPSLGRFSEDGAGEAVRFAATNTRVVYTDVRNVAQVADVATGRSLAAVQLSDRALSVCASATGAFWVEVADGQHVLVDPATGRGVPGGARPADCFPTRGPGAAECGTADLRPSATCVVASSDAVPGMSTRAMVVGPNETFVAFGVRSPGTPTPTLAVKNAGGVLWQRAVPGDSVNEAAETTPDAFDVAGGSIFVAFHRRDNSVRVVGIDATSGQTLWESSPPRSQGSAPDVLTVGRDRVYVPHWTWLDVFDRATGAHVRTLGRW